MSDVVVHVACLCTNGRSVLALLRSPDQGIYPGFWEGPGGAILPGETFENGASRKMVTEAGIIGRVGRPVATYSIVSPGLPTIPGVRMLVEVDGEPMPSISSQHIAWKWIPVSEIDTINWIPGIVDDIRLAFQ